MLPHEIFLKIICTLFGLLVGSFLNVVIYRVPREESIAFPGSHCPKCSHKIRWYENIPVLSYVFLNGKCSQCKTEIPIQYPLVELAMGIIGFLLAPKFFSLKQAMIFIFYFSVASIFLSHLIIDIRHKLLPDKINLYFLAIAVPYAFIFLPFTHAIVGGAIGFLGPYTVTWLFWKIRGQIGLGGGDIKLFGILGILLGPIGILNNIFVSCTLGAVVGLLFILFKRMDKNTALPFGPFIIIVATIQIFFPEIAEYFNFFAPN
ncbi:MAG: prepilin peptidase [Halobacteriovoraceae bacterium]|nr:prepilin peptidase [Halobacteriovoraceae bacterium]|tara:strand:- start:5659 stop:6441 length:783 start_codon:yes stop_codon:yes gene_type:complete